MNWSKAKTILIIALIITDVFLLLMYGKSSFTSKEFSDNEALAELLGRNGIHINADAIPKKHYDLPVLYVQNAGAGEKDVSGENNVRVSGDNNTDYKKASDAFIKAAGSDYKTAVFHGIERENGCVTAIYKNAANNTAIENNRIALVFRNGVLEGFSYKWLTVTGAHNKPQKTISAAQALLLFMALDGRETDIHVDRMEMVYWLDESVQIDMPVFEDTAFPMWKISYNNGGYDYIDAYGYN